MLKCLIYKIYIISKNVWNFYSIWIKTLIYRVLQKNRSKKRSVKIEWNLGFWKIQIFYTYITDSNCLYYACIRLTFFKSDITDFVLLSFAELQNVQIWLKPQSWNFINIFWKLFKCKKLEIFQNHQFHWILAEHFFDLLVWITLEMRFFSKLNKNLKNLRNYIYFIY